jgi:hypothetical protein
MPFAEADQPVVYVATGTIVRLTQGQVDAVVEAMRAVEGARFVWSLPKVSGGGVWWGAALPEQAQYPGSFHPPIQPQILPLSFHRF